MFCPNCGASWPEEDRFCSNCGCPMHSDTPDTPSPKKGGRLAPVLLMVLMAVLGTIAYFAIRPAAAPSREAPWFTMQGNTLVDFDPAAYTGGSDMTIPAAIDGVQVLAIGDGCFSGCDSLVSVTLPQQLQAIGRRAFEDCTSLRGIFIPSSVTEIGDYAFRGCAGLEAICLTPGTQFIGSGAFDQCGNLVYIIFAGPISQWQALYDDEINPFTHVYCNEGIFSQVGKMP